MTDPARRSPTAIRSASLDDLGEIRSILAEHGNDGPFSTVDIVGPYLRHLITTARAQVALDDRGIAGFGATIATGTGRHLTDLFVQTDRLGRGIGRPLLDELFGDDWPRTTFASDDPRAMPIYIRAGLVPLWPALYITGSAANLPDADGEMSVESADASRLADIERDWTGTDRSIDHAFWASQADADSFVVLDTQGIVAGGYARARQNGPDRALDRLVIRPDRDPLAPVVAALRRAARGGRVRACLPGPNPAVRPLLEAGFHIEDRDTYMASRPDLIDPGRLLPNPGMF